MKKPLTSLAALALLFSVMSCNSGSDKETTKTDQVITQTDTPKAADTIQVVNNNQDSPIITPKKPATSNVKIEDAEFHKVLSYKNISFVVTAKGKGSLQKLSIQPSGLSGDNSLIALEVEPVVGAVVEDLNQDGYPELLVFTQSAGSGSYGKVLGYSVNKGKSMSRVTMRAANENPQISEGYMGHDQFKVVNKQLVQSFPLFEKSDNNSTRTGKNRVVSYKLKDGEASRIFEVDKVTDTNK